MSIVVCRCCGTVAKVEATLLPDEIATIEATATFVCQLCQRS